MLVRLVLTACLAAAATPAQQVEVGKKAPDFRFAQVVMNGDGRTAIGEFIGQPVLIEYWGTR